MSIKDTCKKRYIGGGAETPLLVPSFSSTVGPDIDIGIIYDKVKEQLGVASLVSAYDLSNKIITMDNIWHSQDVFIDSGTYENRILNKDNQTVWSIQKYENLLDQLKPLARVILVNYDQVARIDDQISAAK